MRKFCVLPWLLALIVLLPLTSRGQTNTINPQWLFQNFTTHPINVSRVIITPLCQGADYTNFTLGGANLSSGPLYFSSAANPSLTNGSLIASNLLCGFAYQIQFNDGYSNPMITNYFPVSLTNTSAGTVQAINYQGIILAQTGGIMYQFAYFYLNGFSFTTNYLTITNTVNNTNVFNLTNNISGGTNFAVQGTNAGAPVFLNFVAWVPTNYDLLGAATNQGAQNTNFSLVTGLGNTNFTLATGLGNTNFSLVVGQANTNFTLSTGLGNTNFTLAIGQGATNLINTNGINGTNFTLTTATGITNLIGTNGINGTNFTLAIGQGGTNFTLSTGQNNTNFTMATGQSVTNLVNTNGVNSTNFTLLNATGNTNYTLSVGLGGTNFTLATGLNNTNFTLATGQGNTNLSLAVGQGSTNFTFSLGQVLTNNIATNGINATNQSGVVLQSSTNYTLASGVGITNAITAQGAANTNFTLQTGLNNTNFTFSLGQALTNFVLSAGLGGSNNVSLAGQGITNLINTNGINSTNFTLLNATGNTNFTVQTATTLTNNIISQGAANTNFTLSTGTANTNFTLATGLGNTNFTLSTGLNLTNDVSASSNAAVLAGGLLGTNAALAQGAANTNNEILLNNSVSNTFRTSFITITSGVAQVAFGVGGHTNHLLLSTNIIGVFGSSMPGVDGTFKVMSGSLWTNTAIGSLPGFDVSLSSGIYSVRSNLVSLYTITNGLPGILQPTAAGVGTAVIYNGFYRRNNGVVDVGVWDNSNAVVYFQGQLNSVSNFFATNFVTGPLQASNLTGAFLANLIFTNGANGQVFESDGAGGWLWSNTVPIAVTANSANTATTAIGISGNALTQVTNIAQSVGGGGGGSTQTNSMLINGNTAAGGKPLSFGSISASANTPLQIFAGNTNAPIAQLDGENGSANLILGDTNNSIQFLYTGSPIFVSPWYQSIVGGNSNLISQANVFNASIWGGSQNWIKGTLAFHHQSSIVGGANNYITGVGLTNNTIVGGEFNGINGNANGGTIIQDSIVLGGVSNLCQYPYSTAGGWMGQAENRSVWIWSDEQTNLGAFTSTGTNQFLIRANGGVGINTNNPAGFGLNVNGTVNSTGLYINGAAVGAGGGATNLSPWTYAINGNGFPLTNTLSVDASTIKQGGTNLQTIINNSLASGGAATNAIPLLNGIGTNTTLIYPTFEFVSTNYVWTNSTIVLSGSINTNVNGTYKVDANHGSSIYNAVSNYYATGATTLPYPAPVIFWTNSSGNTTNNWQLAFWGTNNVAFSNNIVCLSVTNSCGKFVYITTANAVGGVWPGGNICWGPADFVSGSGVANPTNLIATPFYSANQFQPIGVDMIPQGGLPSTPACQYTYPHGLGHKPHFVSWEFKCIQNDPLTGLSAGQSISVVSIVNNGTRVTYGSDSNFVWISFSYPLVGWEGYYNLNTYLTGVNTSPSSFTNFLLHVDYFP